MKTPETSIDSPTILNPKGGYRFLPGIEPYSSGIIAEPGFEIVHVTLMRPLPWRGGLHSARRYLESINLTPYALCGVELRCPKPHTMDGFIEFNRDYRALLDEWGIPVGGETPSRGPMWLRSCRRLTKRSFSGFPMRSRPTRMPQPSSLPQR